MSRQLGNPALSLSRFFHVPPFLLPCIIGIYTRHLVNISSMSPAAAMSPVIGLVLLLASGYVSSLAAPEYNSDTKLPEPDTDEELAKPGWSSEKPGSCPADVDYPTCNPLVTYKSECKKDRDCKGPAKCCFSGCTNRCLLPLQAKLNPCPCFNVLQCITVRPLPAECHSDYQCQGTDRCCFSNCRNQCTPTERVKPGQCPALKKKIIAKACTKDSDCTGTKKCCGLKCVTPEQERPGVCPSSGLENLSCPYLNRTLCSRDSDCPEMQKCCLSGDVLQCQAVKSVKPGSCPITLTRCGSPPPTPLCSSDKYCPGEKKCCTPWCQQACTNPDTKIPEKECPVVETFAPCKQPYPQPECGSDSECGPGQMCCDVGCKVTCTEV